MHFDTGRTWRGGQNQVFLLMSGLKKEGMKQHLVTPADSPLEKKAIELGIEVSSVDPANDLDVIKGLKFRRIAKKEKPDIIHFHTSKSLGIGCWALAGVKVKTVFTRRVDLPVSTNSINLFKYRSADKKAVISDFINDHFKSIGFDDAVRIFSAVDTGKFQCKDEYNENETVNIGMVGAFDLRHKDFITFIKAADLVLKERENEIQFLIAGQGKDEDMIRELINGLGIQKYVKVEGFIPEIQDFMLSLDILVHTVNFEALGTSILQGMSCGLPVIATDVGGIPELIEEGKNGYLVEKNNVEQTAGRIIELIDNTSKQKELGLRNRLLVERKFSAEKMVSEYLKLYRGLYED
ncbi:glycosyltransferase [Elusimicrobiota bacterium]